MIKPIKIIWSLVFMILLFGTSGIYAQSTPISEDSLRRQFEKQVSNVHQEKVYVHLDRSSYITGETIWVSAYCIDAAFHTPVDVSKVLNIEIIDGAGKPVKQMRIQLAEGLGSGQLFVSPDIQSGHYILRAYTNWMKNFDSHWAFEKHLKILNPASVPELESYVEQQPTVEFFPEGGTLVSGLKGKVAIKAMDGIGNGQKLTGIIYDDNDVEVTEFSTSDMGYGFFYLTPDHNRSYVARVLRDSTIVKYQLPKVSEAGVSLAVRSSENGDWIVSVNQTDGFTSNIYLVVHTRGIINRIQRLTLPQIGEISIEAGELTSGISHITLLNSEFMPLCERLIFNYPENHQQPALNTGNEFQQRDLVKLSLTGHEKWNEKDLAHLSVSVYRSEDSAPVEENIISNLLLTSDLRGHIPDPLGYFDPNNYLRTRQLDLIMLTNGWRRFDWEQIKAEPTWQMKYPAEINTAILSGKVEKYSQRTVPKSLQVNFVGRASVMNSVDLGANGIFHLEVPMRVDSESVLFFTNRDTIQPGEISVFSPFDLEFSPKKLFGQRFKPESQDYFESLNANIQVSQLYRSYNYINGMQEINQREYTPFYGTPDHQYLLDNYTRFETVEDLFIEFIRSAVIRDNNRIRGFQVVYDSGLLPGSALTLIDGVPVMDFDYVMNFDPLVVEKISVVNNAYRMGSIEYPGIIEFTTYTGDFDGQDLPQNLVEQVYHALEVPRAFYSPDYADQQLKLSRIPDYRNTLYWNPQVQVGADGTELEFYTSDDTGSYRVEINGITSNGEPVFLQSSFEVTQTVE